MLLAYLTLTSLILTTAVCVNKFIEECYNDICENFHSDRCLVAIILSLLFTAWGLKRKSLSWSGAIGGMCVGFIITFSSYCFMACLLTFFFTSSKATHFQSDKKRKFEAHFKEGGQRNWIQVICNGGTATQMTLIYLLYCGPGEFPIEFDKNYFRSFLATGVLASFASANGDTWASELSVMSKASPRLITTFQKVPVGTNGGITAAGVLCSALGGAIVGLSYFLVLILTVKNFHVFQQAFLLLCVGLFSGLFGSFLDSILGATLQYSGFDPRTGKIVEEPKLGVKHISGMPILDNHSVNLLMTIITSILVPIGTAKLYSYF